jgi:hypothetical protein
MQALHIYTFKNLPYFLAKKFSFWKNKVPEHSLCKFKICPFNFLVHTVGWPLEYELLEPEPPMPDPIFKQELAKSYFLLK